MHVILHEMKKKKTEEREKVEMNQNKERKKDFLKIINASTSLI